MEFEVKAVARYIPISPQKVRLVLAAVRGRGADEALAMLKFMPQGAARPVAKLIQSAIANAEENYGMNREDLFIYRVFADDGPRRPWRRFGARGRWKPIIRRSSHVTVVLGEREVAVKPAPKTEARRPRFSLRRRREETPAKPESKDEEGNS
jgi:large subunit ribosomal protein L22